MAADSETETPRGRELLRVTYKGRVYNLPVAGNIIDLKLLLGARAVPGLARFQEIAATGDDVGIALIQYMYDANEFFVGQPEAEEKLKEALEKSGLGIEDLKRIDPIMATRHELVQHKRLMPYYTMLDNFADGTYIIGPLLARKKPIVMPFDEELFDIAQEIELSTLDLGYSVAVHGNTLLAGMAIPDGQDRVFDREIIPHLERLFHPYQI